MSITVADIIRLMEEIAPAQLAETWDNPGLQVGDTAWPVKKILVSLDPTPAVMAHAAEDSVDMLITHHPLLFKPLKSVDLSTPIGAIVGVAIQNTIAVYAAHTNFDSAREGLNDMLATRLGLKNVTVLSPHGKDESDSMDEPRENGLGRIGDLTAATDLDSLCRRLKQNMGLESVRMVGDPGRTVARVAVCSGSGSSLLDRFFSSGADVFITGDIRYHEAREAEDRQAALIDIGHFGSERIMIAQLASRLKKMLGKLHSNVEVITCEAEKDPFIVV